MRLIAVWIRIELFLNKIWVDWSHERERERESSHSKYSRHHGLTSWGAPKSETWHFSLSQAPSLLSPGKYPRSIHPFLYLLLNAYLYKRLWSHSPPSSLCFALHVHCHLPTMDYYYSSSSSPPNPHPNPSPDPNCASQFEFLYHYLMLEDGSEEDSCSQTTAAASAVTVTGTGHIDQLIHTATPTHGNMKMKLISILLLFLIDFACWLKK